MKVRCKFICNSVTHFAFNSKVELIATSRPDGEDKAFYEATPSGNISFNTVNREAVRMFEPGQAYYIDIEKA